MTLLEENQRIQEAGSLYAKLYIAEKQARFTNQDRLRRLLNKAFCRLERRLNKFADYLEV